MKNREASEGVSFLVPEREEGKDMWNLFLTSNESKWRTLRTIVQGIIGVLIANIDLIIGNFSIDASMKALIVALVMAILSPCMKALGTNSDATATDTEE